MKTDKPSLLIFAILGLAALISFIFQIYYSTIRPLTPVEMSLISFIGVLFSIVSGWYFSKIYSKENYDETVSRIVKILEGCNKVGIDAIEPSLLNGTTTIIALDKISYGFDFLGIAGSKFIPQLFDESKKIGRFIAKNERYTVRIMLLNPECSQIDRWLGNNRKKADKVRNDIRSMLSLLKTQIRMGRRIQVKLYDFSPPIRLQIVDKEKAYLCEYDPFSDGWDTPQLCFSKKGDRPFINSLICLYDYLWDHGKDFDVNP